MYVKCIREFRYLTVGKTYWVKDSEPSRVYVTMDIGKGSWCPNDVFCVVDDKGNDISLRHWNHYDVSEWDVVKYLNAVFELNINDAKMFAARLQPVPLSGDTFVPLPELTKDKTIIMSKQFVLTAKGIMHVKIVSDFKYDLLNISEAMRFAHNLLVTPLLRVTALESEDGVEAGKTYTVKRELPRQYELREYYGKADKDIFTFADCSGHKPDSVLWKYFTCILQGDITGAVRLLKELPCGEAQRNEYVTLPVIHEDGSLSLSEHLVVSGANAYKSERDWIAGGEYSYFTPIMRVAYNLCQKAEYGNDVEVLAMAREPSEESLAKQILDSVPSALGRKYSGSDIKKALQIACELLCIGGGVEG